MKRLVNIILSITALTMLSAMLLVVILVMKAQSIVPFFHVSDYKADKLVTIISNGLGMGLGGLQ